MNTKNDFLIISIMAKQGGCFASYELLQAIAAAGMRIGEGNLFHYYATQHSADAVLARWYEEMHTITDNNKNILFSLASATTTGKFDWDKIGDFTCPGLVLFMDLNHVIQPLETFNTMLTIAEQLADDLDGELRADPRTPWSEEILKQYHQKIRDVAEIHSA